MSARTGHVERDASNSCARKVAIWGFALGAPSVFRVVISNLGGQGLAVDYFRRSSSAVVVRSGFVVHTWRLHPLFAGAGDRSVADSRHSGTTPGRLVRRIGYGIKTG